MELIRGLHNLLPRHHGCVMTIGNFDGVHRGHQQIIQHLRAQSDQLNLPTLLVTFEPLPQEFFTTTLPRLTRLREKFLLLKKHKIDRILVLGFNQDLANLSAENFVKQIVVDALGVQYMLEGDDFHFGSHRDGDIDLLKKLGKQYNFTAEKMDTLVYKEKRISSSLIREALAQGDIEHANAMLGYNYAMHGRVVHGDKLGRQLGVPTANIKLHRNVSPLLGIYVVLLHGIAAKPLQGVASIGYRPTLGGEKKLLLEVHLLDFNQDIYGRYVHVEFLQKIRDEEKFASLDELKTQMFRDIEQARTYFADRK